MRTVGAVLLVVAVIAVLAIVVPRYIAKRDREQLGARCNALRQQLAVARGQGGDQAEAARIETELRACTAQLGAAGVAVDPALDELAIAQSQAQQIRAEWGHYRSTDDTDAIKRNSTRQTILRIGDELARSLRRAADGATTLAGLQAVREETLKQIAESWQRGECFARGEAGCSRFGLNESDWDERQRDEMQRILFPLIGTYSVQQVPGWSRLDPSDPTFAPRIANSGQRQTWLDAIGPRVGGAVKRPGVLDTADARIATFEGRVSPDVLRAALGSSLGLARSVIGPIRIGAA